MPTTALRRLLFAAACLLAAGLACVSAELPIQATSEQIATPLPPPATATLSAAEAASSAAAVPPTATASPIPTLTPLFSPTPTRDFDIIPVLNGTFDTDLNGWQYTPDWVLWQDGYARANASDIIGGASLIQTVQVPGAPSVILHFRVRSEELGAGECWVESKFRSVHVFPEDQQWHDFTVDFTTEAGTIAPVSLTAKNNGLCHWLHLDDVYWMVTLGYQEATATPLPTDVPSETPPPSATSLATGTPGAVATLPSIPDGAALTQDFTVLADGDTPIGNPRDLRDKQTITWASLRNGIGYWVFDLGSTQNIAGVRLYAHRDGNQDTTLQSIEISSDGSSWTIVMTGSGDCAGTANCDTLAQETYLDFGFGPVAARYVRLRGGPTRFALAEVLLAVMP